MFTVTFQTSTISHFKNREYMDEIRDENLGEFSSLADAHDRALSEAVLWDGLVWKLQLFPYGWVARTHSNEYGEYIETACYILNEQGSIARS